MKNVIKISAPGKLMLLGEHAVVYNHPCLVTSVNQRMQMEITSNTSSEFLLNAPDVNISDYHKKMSEIGMGDIPKGARFVEQALLNFLNKCNLGNSMSGLAVKTSTDFSSLFGFGSSSASTVCAVKGFDYLYETNLSDRDIFDISYKTILDIQGKGSGFDVASAIYGKILYFKTGGVIIEPLNISKLPLVVGYSGNKADTKTLMDQVANKMKIYPEKVAKIYNSISDLVDQSRIALINEDWERFGVMMNLNQEYLRDLGVSTAKLEDLISVSLRAGAIGAKLSGAGGGDSMIALVDDMHQNQVIEAINKAGGQVIPVEFNCDGVRLENI